MTHSIPDWSYDVYTNRWLGVPMSQAWMDLYLWELLFQSIHVRQVIELGTYRGGMTAYLGLQCFQRKIEFATIDINDPDIPEMLPLYAALEIEALKGDMFRSRRLKSLLTNKPVLLFCDGGNKVNEFLVFLSYLSPGDYIAVHDWGVEFQPSDVPAGVEMVMQDKCEQVGALTRFFRVVE